MLGLHRDIPTGYLDGARGIAVLIVWLSHSSGRDQALAPWLSFHGIGHVGVMLFFVLSGYLLARPLARGGAFDYGPYLLRRFLRIAPLYWLVLVGVAVYQLTIGVSSTRYLFLSDGFRGLVEHLVFIKGDGVFWTIATEFVFYLILPPLALALVRYRSRGLWTLLAVSFLYGAYHMLVTVNRLELPALKLVDTRQHSQFLDVFAIGVACGFLSVDAAARRFYALHRKRLDALALAAFLTTLLCTCILVSKRFLWFEQPFYHFRYASFGYALVFGLTLLSAQLGNARLRSLLDWKPFRFCGVVGYSWYLLHLPVLAAVNQLALAPPMKFALSTAAVAVISCAGYLLIEEPFIRLGKRIAASPRAAEMPAASRSGA